MPMFTPPTPGETRQQKISRRGDNAMTFGFLALLLLACAVAGFMLWVTIVVAPDVANWAGPR